MQRIYYKSNINIKLKYYINNKNYYTKMSYSVEEELNNLNNKVNNFEKNVKHNFDITGNELVQLSANVEKYKNKQILTENIIEQHIIFQEELTNHKLISLSNKEQLEELNDKFKDMENQMKLYTKTIRRINILRDEELDIIEKKIKINSQSYKNLTLLITVVLVSFIFTNYLQLYKNYIFIYNLPYLHYFLGY